MKFKPSKLLTKSENRELEVFESLLYVAPLPKADESRYLELVSKAHRKSRLW